MKTLLGLMIALIVISFSTVIYAANKTAKVTYKWVDDNNIVQFTERPPKDRAYEKIIVTTSGGREVTTVTEEQAKAEARQETNANIEDVNQANARNCQIARQNMDVLKNIARIRVTENGQERVLSPEEKAQRVQDTQKQIDVFCKAPVPPAATTDEQ